LSGDSLAISASLSDPLFFLPSYYFEEDIPMPTEVMEEELLRSIEEVEDRIKMFRKRVRAVLTSAQSEVSSDSGLEEGS
tara:strand:- start:73 stop:309 length:237 start_codon:yes stop_codon:yes gene_type:complete